MLHHHRREIPFLILLTFVNASFSSVVDKNSLEVLSTRRQKLSQDCNFDNSHMHVYDSIVLSFLRMDEELHYQLISWH